MLSPTQFRPITTVSARLPISGVPRPFPAIVHPEPEVGAGGDTTGNHVVDPCRQRHRIPFYLSESIDTNRFFELETMPRFVRNAKSEHNRRAPPDGQLRGRRCRPRRTPDKGSQDTFARKDGLVGQHDDNSVLFESFEQRPGGVTAVDHLRARAGADASQIALEILVVEAARHRADTLCDGCNDQAADFPTAVMGADDDHALPRGHGLVEDLAVDDLAAREHFLDRHVLHTDVEQKLSAEMAPALAEDRPQLGVTALRKRRAEIAQGEAVAAAEEFARQRAEARAPAIYALLAHRADRGGDGTIRDVLDGLQEPVLFPHRRTTAAIFSSTSSAKTNSAGMETISVAWSFTASFSVVTMFSAAEAAAATRIAAMSASVYRW